MPDIVISSPSTPPTTTPTTTAPTTTEAGCGGHTCACQDAQTVGYPEFDARTVPHAVRHASIFGALGSLTAGSGIILVAPHDPLPLLAQLQERTPDAFDVSYVERGPDAWRLAFVRR